jgi:molybdenum cofactor guanylyltransferase
MVGVILSGGQSSRMGSDKGLLKTADGETWVKKAFTLVQQVVTEVVVSVNAGQVNNYRSVFAPKQLVTDSAQIPVKGPLLGLLSTHLRFPDKELLLLACDMVQMDKNVLLTLIDQYNTYNGKDVYLFLNDGVAEPLCAVYTAPALAKLLESYKTGQRNRWSMKYILSELEVHNSLLLPEWTPFFANINTKEELGS